MTWIRTVDEREVTGPLRECYETDLNNLGVVLEATKALSTRPELAAVYDALRRTIFGQPGLNLRERRLINLVVADRLRSTACVLYYAIPLERELGGPAGIRAVLDDHRAAGLSAREVAILDYALGVALGDAREEHVGRLRGAGLDDAATLEVAFTAAFRLFGCRLHDGLGVEIDAFLLEQEDLLAALPPHHKGALRRHAGEPGKEEGIWPRRPSHDGI